MPPEFAVPSWAVELLDPFASSADGPEGSTVDEDLAFIASLDWMSGGDDGTVLVARAPGRLDVMGGIADYSGALVLQLPLREGCYAALRRTSAETDGDAAIIVTSRAHAGDGRAERVLVPLSALVRRARSCDDAPAKRARTSAACAAAEPIGWDEWAALKATWPADELWAAYVVGGLLVLMHDGFIVPVTGRYADDDGADDGRRSGVGESDDGFVEPVRLCGRAVFGDRRLDVSRDVVELLLESEVPADKGVSSSAAVEVATLSALAHAFGAARLTTDPRELALCAQRVENHAVGAPCGVMDQMASAVGLRAQLMALECQPATVRGHVQLPAHLRLWGIDSGVRHSVGGADYGSVRAAAFMGRALLADARAAAGSAPAPLEYLVHVRPSELDSAAPAERAPAERAGGATHRPTLAHMLPETMSGAAFLAAHPHGHGDSATRVEPERAYAVRAAVSHPIREHARAQQFELLLAAPPSARQLDALGEIMYASHASYSAVGLGSDATDDIVRRVRARGGTCGLHGAKITGGGSGGTVCVLTDDSDAAERAVREIAREYGEARLPGGAPARVFEGSSRGAAQFGALLLRREA
ncbi:hypothetical protein KFE25_002913 [Diacronema lutheri]|uniref:GHMP kinase N-terminal domain-containing protein n=1 Tax=Diacronema lutheri TaxID=2081491 RepID=A0A8J6CC10_DIALT|nr:hypothetical protein KFE25_002913 [Diacronema lutheri]